MKKINYAKKNELFLSLLREISIKTRIEETKDHIQHGNTSVYEHSLKVAYYSLIILAFLGKIKNEKELIRGALLHDYFLYDWHIKRNRPKGLHGYTHPTTAYRNASKRINLTPIESDIIMKHMFTLTTIPPKFFESYVVCLVDKVCSTCETLKLDSLFNKYPRLKS